MHLLIKPLQLNVLKGRYTFSEQCRTTKPDAFTFFLRQDRLKHIRNFIFKIITVMI
jgi:hypothetical protein